MAERVPRSREPDLRDLDLDLDQDLATGIGVVINIGNGCSHLTTSNSANGSHTRNIHMMNGGSNNHVGNDSHDDSMATSGTSRGTHHFGYLQATWLTSTCFIPVFESSLTPETRNSSEVRAESVPLARRPPRDHIAIHSPGQLDRPTSFFLRPPYQASTGRPRSESILFPLHLQEPEMLKARSNSFSVLPQTGDRPASLHPRDEEGNLPRPPPHHPGHRFLSLAFPAYVDRPPHQDVAIQHIHCEPEASLQTDWADSQLTGRVIELSAADTHLHRRTMVVMAISTGARFLQCLHICRHPEVLRNSAGFYETHVAVVEGREAEDLPAPSGNAAVTIDQPEIYALRTHCYINYQHVWTVRRDVIFRNIGSVADFPRLKYNFREAQKRLYEDE